MEERITEEIVSIDNEGKKSVEIQTEIVKNGEVIEQKSYHEDDDLIQLESNFNSEEVLTQNR